MRDCYEDETLDVSKENFERPKELTIEVDCNAYEEGSQETLPEEDVPDELDF